MYLKIIAVVTVFTVVVLLLVTTYALNLCTFPYVSGRLKIQLFPSLFSSLMLFQMATSLAIVI